jgi:hypothetical protein
MYDAGYMLQSMLMHDGLLVLGMQLAAVCQPCLLTQQAGVWWSNGMVAAAPFSHHDVSAASAAICMQLSLFLPPWWGAGPMALMLWLW